MNPERHQAQDDTEENADSRTSIAESTGEPFEPPQPGKTAVSRSTEEADTTGTVGQAEYPRDTEGG
ncbi:MULTISPECIES: hypothetical protein [Amycolatopsis]|uniref:Uncharacterized protein n=1 Tax=Amycolatopsis tucumanensis TaxID=401106 RepID=A0ABP7JG95_9PSEU|nr:MULTISPECIES: hypothetical protein [Amycolatopsis]MCF6426550.1 hypothetical protein [Amycolatopsis tucumanensis]